MIQSAGMTAAAATIATMQVQVEMYAIVYATIGGVCGLVLGLEKVSSSPPDLRSYRLHFVSYTTLHCTSTF